MSIDTPDSKHLERYLPRDRRRAYCDGIEIPDRVSGAALFADISGFTPLTAALASELGTRGGAEELNLDLNRVLHALIEILHRHGGDVVYFSGDAITCWINGDDGFQATACGLAMQRAMAAVADIVTSGGTHHRLGLKVAVVTGDARRFVVGDPEIQLIDVLAGRMIDALAEQEQVAHAGDVVLDSAAFSQVSDRVALKEMRDIDGSTRTVAIVDGIDDSPVPPSMEIASSALDDDFVQPWILPAVAARLESSSGEFLPELRPTLPLFVRFGGIDYDDDDDAMIKLDAFIRHVQRIVTAYGGNLLQLTLGDKGAYVYVVFGSPVAHEDDAARAAAAALELRELDGFTAATGLQIGIGYGRLYSGTCGHADRQTFTCLGTAVNFAARLMMKAPPGAIYVADTVRHAAGDRFDWTPLPLMQFKGIAEPQAVHGLLGRKTLAPSLGAVNRLSVIGRTREFAAISHQLDAALAGQGHVLALSGDPGIGKSRLLLEAIALAAERGFLVASGECPSFGEKAGYQVWRRIWMTILGLDESQTTAEQVAAVERALATVDPGLVRRAPLLAGLLDLPIPDNTLTRAFDSKLRKTSLEGLLGKCLQAQARARPTLITLDNGQWLDPLSRDLLVTLAKASTSCPVLIVVAHRRDAGVRNTLGLDALPRSEEITVGELDAAETTALIRARYAYVFGTNTEPPPALINLVSARVQGNPLFVEELLNFIRAQHVDLRDRKALRQLDMPESLHSLVLSRIDGLDEIPRRLLKVASVVGRVFQTAELNAAYPDLGDADSFSDCLNTLQQLDFIEPKLGARDPSFAFRQVYTRDIVYESIPYAFRTTLHESIGNYLEGTTSSESRHLIDLLAHHFRHSGNTAKKIEYLGRAGEAAKTVYANDAAIDYFESLAALLDEADRVDVLLKLGEVLELVGSWQRAGTVYEEARKCAASIADRSRCGLAQLGLAEVARKQTRYDDALTHLSQANLAFEEGNDIGGSGRVLHLQGTIAAQRGDCASASAMYEQSLTIRDRLDDKHGMAGLLSNLGVIAEYGGDYSLSREYHHRALALRNEIGDRRAIGVSLNNLGMVAVLRQDFVESRAWFEQAIAIYLEIGEPWMLAISQNNMGNAARGLGDYAAACNHYRESLRTYRECDDPWGVAFLLEDIGLFAAACGNSEAAWELVGAADGLHEASGSPRAPSRQEEIEGFMARTRILTDDERLAALARGRARIYEEAVEFAWVTVEMQTTTRNMGSDDSAFA